DLFGLDVCRKSRPARRRAPDLRHLADRLQGAAADHRQCAARSAQTCTAAARAKARAAKAGRAAPAAAIPAAAAGPGTAAPATSAAAIDQSVLQSVQVATAPPSLRGAQRQSNPVCERGLLDCFASLAMTSVTRA